MRPLHEKSVNNAREEGSGEAQPFHACEGFDIDGAHFAFAIAASHVEEAQQHGGEDQNGRCRGAVAEDDVWEVLPVACVTVCGPVLCQHTNAYEEAAQRRYWGCVQRLMDFSRPRNDLYVVCSCLAFAKACCHGFELSCSFG